MTAQLRKVLAVLAASLCLLFAGVAYFFYTEASRSQEELVTLQVNVRQQQVEAEARLKKLTAERDAKQAALTELQRSQENTDAAAKEQIARLTTELERTPVRVRLKQDTSRGGSGGTPGPPSANPQAGPGDPAEAYGVLPEGNAQRLREVIAEAELINAAYASCRRQVYGLHETLID